MKKSTLFLLFGTLILFSCQSQGDDSQEPQPAKLIECSISFNNFIEVITTRGSEPYLEDYLLGLQIYKDSRPYAYGVFNSLEDIRVKFAEGESYSIACCIMTEVGYIRENDRAPFALNSGEELLFEPTDGIVYDVQNDMDPLSNHIYSETTSYKLYPGIVVYLGETSFSASENTPVRIEMNQYNFRININAINLTEGTLLFRFENMAFEVPADNPFFSEIFNFPYEGYGSSRYEYDFFWRGGGVFIGPYPAYFTAGLRKTTTFNVVVPAPFETGAGIEFGEVGISEQGEEINVTN